MNRKVNHQEAKMPKIYIKCLHCEGIEATVLGESVFDVVFVGTWSYV